MAIQVQGNGGVVAEVETNTRAVRVVQRPTDVGALGAYSCALTTGTMAAGLSAASTFWSIRNGSANVAVVRSVTLSMGSLGTGFAVGSATFNLLFARPFSANNGGGTSATLTSNNCKLKTAFATTGISDIRISSTGTLTGTSWTLDAQPIGSVNAAIDATQNKVFIPTTQMLPGPTGLGGPQWPVVLAQNEGLVIQATVPATGTWQGQVLVTWEENTAY